MATTIHDKLYVTIQYSADANNESGLLGFASPYTKDGPFEKRKRSQDNWAYGSGISVVIDGDTCVLSENPAHTKKWDLTSLFMANCYPKILDNEAVGGFEIAKSVRRHGWSGGGNVKWRVTDPRGFDLEISSENFASIVSCTTMENGVIKGKCVWGREGSANILLPESSEPYKIAYKRTRLAKEKVSISSIKRGDLVTLVTKSTIGYMGARYMGYMHAVTTTGTREVTSPNPMITVGISPTTVGRHVFEDLNKPGKYFCIMKPVVGEVDTKVEEELDLDECVRLVNAAMSGDRDSVSDSPSNAVLMIPKASDLKTLTLSLKPHKIVMVDGKFPKERDWSSEPELFVVNKGSDWYIGHNMSQARDHPVLIKVDVDAFDRGKIEITANRRTPAPTYSYYVRNSGPYLVAATKLVGFDIAEFETKAVWIKAGNIESRLTRMPYGLTWALNRE